MTRKAHTMDEIKDKWESVKEKGSEFAHQVQDKSADFVHAIERNPTTKSFWHYAKTHKKESVLGGFMLLGLIFSFYWLGSLVVGLGAGLYAPFGIKGIINKAQAYREREGNFPTFMWLIAGVFMLFHIFPFMIGAALGLAINSFLSDEYKGEVSRKNSK
jgi:hypothetical protein